MRGKSVRNDMSTQGHVQTSQGLKRAYNALLQRGHLLPTGGGVVKGRVTLSLSMVPDEWAVEHGYGELAVVATEGATPAGMRCSAFGRVVLQPSTSDIALVASRPR